MRKSRGGRLAIGWEAAAPACQPGFNRPPRVYRKKSRQKNADNRQNRNNSLKNVSDNESKTIVSVKLLITDTIFTILNSLPRNAI